MSCFALSFETNKRLNSIIELFEYPIYATMKPRGVQNFESLSFIYSLKYAIQERRIHISMRFTSSCSSKTISLEAAHEVGRIKIVSKFVLVQFKNWFSRRFFREHNSVYLVTVWRSFSSFRHAIKIAYEMKTIKAQFHVSLITRDVCCLRKYLMFMTSTSSDKYWNSITSNRIMSDKLELLIIIC